MPHPHHDRLDLKLKSWQYMAAACGSMNVETKRADYCGFDCPTLVERMQKGEDVTVPIAPIEPADEAGLKAVAEVPAGVTAPPIAVE